MRTIWDQLAAASVTGRYYFSDIPFLALWGTTYLPISHPFATFLSDAATGQLPQVSFTDPRFEDEGSGTSQDDHPHADIRAGEQFLNQVYKAVTSSPNWSRTLLVVNFDEWGGFCDHVAPALPRMLARTQTCAGSEFPPWSSPPRARRGFVAHDTYDHTSVLKTIQWRWGLGALTARDAAARNIAEVLDFTTPAQTGTPQFLVPPFAAAACAPSPVQGPEESEWSALRAKAVADGWSLP